MIRTEEKLNPSDPEDEMLVLLPKKKPFQKSNHGRCKSSSQQLETSVQIKLSKLPINMKNYYSVNLRMLHNFSKDYLQRCFILNPDSQIKILEENLNFIKKKGSTYNNFQMRSNLCSLKLDSKKDIWGDSSQDTLAVRPLLEDEKLMSTMKFSGCEFTSEMRDDTFANDSAVLDSSNDETLHVYKSSIPDSPLFSFQQAINTNYSKETTYKRMQSSSMQKNGKVVLSNPLPAKTRKMSKPTVTNTTDIDNQFEFTVEQEKIVSFVCSPSPPRKRRTPPFTEHNELSLSDSETDEPSLSKADSLLETVSNISCKSNTSVSVFNKDNCACWEQIPEVNKLLWHPSSAIEQLELPPVHKLYSSKPTKQNPGKSILSGQVLVNSINNVNSQKNFRVSFNQETVLFREASLRGCYNIENILKDMRPPLTAVQQEVSKVKETIFLAIRSNKNSDDMVPDSILAILDICKSWIKLNSHFELREFKTILESNGVESSILTDFVQWQCISRTFIDKMIHAITKITAHKSESTDPNSYASGLSNHNPIASYKHDLNVPPPGVLNVNNATAMGLGLWEANYSHMFPKSDLVQSKHWKQRRFPSDQPKIGTETNIRKGNNPKTTTSTYFNNPQFPKLCGAELGFGQGDNEMMGSSYDFYASKTNNSLTNKSWMAQGDTNLFMNVSDCSLQSSLTANCCNTNLNLYSTVKHIKEDSNSRNETNMYPITSVNDLTCNAVDYPNNYQCSINTNTLAAVPPFYSNSNQFYFVNPNQFQSNLSQCVIKPNPIMCTDTDISENCLKGSYMKPGSYNPPQKPVHFQKVVNNNIPIEDTPIVGITLYSSSSSQMNSMQSKAFKSAENVSHVQVAKEKCGFENSDDTWKAALSLAETFRDTLMATKASEGPNLKLSDTVSSKAHFLLSDQASQNSTSNDLMLDNEVEEESSGGSPELPAAELKLTVVEAKLKTSDWLNKSFNEKERHIQAGNMRHNDCPSEYDFAEANTTSQETYQLGTMTQTDSSASKMSNKTQNESFCKTFESILNRSSHQPRSELMNYHHQTNRTIPKKIRKNKGSQEELNKFECKSSTLCRKPRSVYKRSITKQVFCKLEHILESIWITEVSHLVEEKLTQIEQESTKLELKIRSPLYLQAMRCKLNNHSYDTLEQALVDFQHYFVDIKNRNKGDKNCIEVVDTLEQMFIDLVEKNFGLVYQPPPQALSPISTSSSVKPRRLKRTPRRC